MDGHLKQRIVRAVRTLLSAVFPLSRASGTAVGLYAVPIVLVLGIELWIGFALAHLDVMAQVADSVPTRA